MLICNTYTLYKTSFQMQRAWLISLREVSRITTILKLWNRPFVPTQLLNSIWDARWKFMVLWSTSYQLVRWWQFFSSVNKKKLRSTNLILKALLVYNWLKPRSGLVSADNIVSSWQISNSWHVNVESKSRRRHNFLSRKGYRPNPTREPHKYSTYGFNYYSFMPENPNNKGGLLFPNKWD